MVLAVFHHGHIMTSWRSFDLDLRLSHQIGIFINEVPARDRGGAVSNDEALLGEH